MRHPLYLLYGIAVIALASVAEWRGWSFTRATEARASPRSIRDNPGTYRPIYVGGSGRYMRGK
jgi:hypothetical protein